MSPSEFVGPLNRDVVFVTGSDWQIVAEQFPQLGGMALDVHAEHYTGARVPLGPNLFREADAAHEEAWRLLHVIG